MVADGARLTGHRVPVPDARCWRPAGGVGLMGCCRSVMPGSGDRGARAWRDRSGWVELASAGAGGPPRLVDDRLQGPGRAAAGCLEAPMRSVNADPAVVERQFD